MSPPGRVKVEFPPIGDRVRFAVQHAGAWKPLGWVRVARDGSIYTGLLLGRPKTAKVVSGPAGREVTVRFTDFKSVPLPKSSRVSFKASGEIHVGDMVLQGKPLSSLGRPRQLCLMTFAHPSRYRTPTKKNANDYDIRVAGYSVVEDKPMYGALVVAPLAPRAPTLPAKLPEMEAATTFALGYRGLTIGTDLVVQVIIGHGPEGPWPESPGVFLAAKPPGK